MRLFVALGIPEDVCRAIEALVAALRPASRSARWARLENLHVTLKFIGEVSQEKSEAIKAALKSVSLPSAIKISFHGLGFFPSERRPRVLWAGIEANAELGALAAAVEAALEPLGIAREQRAFSPHLTLAQIESTRGLDDLKVAIAKAGPLELGGTIAAEFHLYQSILKRSGAEYTRLVTYHFAGEKSQ